MKNEKIKIRDWEISAGVGDWVYHWGADRYRFRVRVKNTKTGKSTWFYFYGSVKDYEAGKDTLNKQDLRAAFWAFLNDAEGGALDFKDFTAEFGYNYDSLTAWRLWHQCKKQTKKAERVGLTKEIRREILTHELNDL
jgi:hypothetical protein